MQFYKVPAPIFQAMANRLSQLPYREVAEMLNAVANIQPREDERPATPEVAQGEGGGAPAPAAG
jgi:hypothetical protein